MTSSTIETDLNLEKKRQVAEDQLDISKFLSVFSNRSLRLKTEPTA